jgi:hypothetical protein
MIQNTVHDLNIHLQRVDEKLADFSISSSQTPGINLADEKAVTKQCLRICEDSKQFLESMRRSSVLEVNDAVEDHHHDSFEAQLLTRQALDENRDRFVNIISHLRSRLESQVFENSPENKKERSRLLDDINTSKQCLEICKVASEVSSQKIYRVGEVIADGDSDQVVANTLADLFDVKKAISKDRSAQLVGSMSGEDLRFLAEKRYESRFGAFVSGTNPPNHPTRTVHMEYDTNLTSRQTNPVSNAPPGPKHEKPSSNEFRKRTD